MAKRKSVMKKTKEYLEKLHYDHLAEMHFEDQERPFLTQFDDCEGLDTTKEQNPLKNAVEQAEYLDLINDGRYIKKNK